MPIKDLQTLFDDGRIAQNLTGDELIFCDQGGKSKALLLRDLAAFVCASCGNTPAPCVPDRLVIPVYFTSEPRIQIYYSVVVQSGLNYANVFDYTPDYSVNSSISAYDVIVALIESDPQLAPLVVPYGNGGTAYFVLGEPVGDSLGNDFRGGGGGVTSNPASVSLLVFGNSGLTGYDFVTEVFGQSVTVHSCGTESFTAS